MLCSLMSLPNVAPAHVTPPLRAGYAAQSLLAALGCVQFVSNVFFASFVLKEQVGPALSDAREACASP